MAFTARSTALTISGIAGPTADITVASSFLCVLQGQALQQNFQGRHGQLLQHGFQRLAHKRGLRAEPLRLHVHLGGSLLHALQTALTSLLDTPNFLEIAAHRIDLVQHRVELHDGFCHEYVLDWNVTDDIDVRDFPVHRLLDLIRATS